MRLILHIQVGSLLSLALALAGCGQGGGTVRCASTSECQEGERCIDGTCEPRGDAGRVDAGPAQDAGAMCPANQQACGPSCCAASEVCGNNQACCAPEEVCGGVCCGGEDRSCVANRCVLTCGERASCGEGSEARCCDSGQVCLQDECTDPGAMCESRLDCPEGSYCEASVDRCLPRATDMPPCEYMPDKEDFELSEQWRWSPAFDGSDSDALSNWNQVMSAPMVANLNDDNGDGKIDERDVPDVVFIAFRKESRTGNTVYTDDGLLRALSGDDGSVLWPTSEPGYRLDPNGSVAIADVREDSPGPEIMGCAFPAGELTGTQQVTIFSNTGELLFRYGDEHEARCNGNVAVADMNGDGVAEIVTRDVIAQADGSGAVEVPWRGTSTPALSDADGDGDLEYIGTKGVAHHDGTVLWEDPSPGRGYPAVADMDLDGDPEIVSTNTSRHTVTIREAESGEILLGPAEINPVDVSAVSTRVSQVQDNYDDRCDSGQTRFCDRDPLTGGGPPTIANFDEDPRPEFALAGGYAYVVFEHLSEGHIAGGDSVIPNAEVRKWYVENEDESSRATGSSVFDFEGDRVAEVVYNDEVQLRSMRGETGEVYVEECNSSGTLSEYPVIVDVDNDDHAEIVVAENNYSSRKCDESEAPSTGIRVFEHPEDQWVRTRRIWNQHTYHVTNIHEDATLPEQEEPNWTADGLNNFRQNVQPDGLLDAPDLVVGDVGFSTRQCTEALILFVRVVNQGRAGAPAGVPVSFYVDGEFVGTAETSQPLLPGASELVEFRYSPVQAGVPYEVTARINDPDHEPLEGVNECRPGNNSSDPVTAACPEVQ